MLEVSACRAGYDTIFIDIFVVVRCCYLCVVVSGNSSIQVTCQCCTEFGI